VRPFTAYNTQAIVDVSTGRMLYARHADGLHVEYAEWTMNSLNDFSAARNAKGACHLSYSDCTSARIGDSLFTKAQTN
jgi:hypothetical protein